MSLDFGRWKCSEKRHWAKRDGEGRGAYSEMLRDKAKLMRPHRHSRALVSGATKIIQNRDGTFEFVDLEHGATRKGLDEAARSRLKDKLQSFRAQLTHRGEPQQTRPLDAETIERMRALGYTE